MKQSNADKFILILIKMAKPTTYIIAPDTTSINNEAINVSYSPSIEAINKQPITHTVRRVRVCIVRTRTIWNKKCSCAKSTV